MKRKLQRILQQMLGYENYLFLFATAKISLFKANTYESEFFEFLNLIPQGTILDIGANIGITAVPLARKFPTQRIHAFEPMPANYNTIERVAKFYKLHNLHLHKVALGEKTGELKMVTPIIKGVRMQGLSHVYAEGEKNEWNSGKIHHIPVFKLDDISFLQNEKTIAAIKIDVENYEYYVLKGGQNLIQKHKPIIYCELWPNEKRKWVFEYLGKLGYTAKIFIHNQLVAYTNQDISNFIFIHDPK